MTAHARAREPIDGPWVWSGAEMAARDDWIHLLGSGDIEELTHAVRHARAACRELYGVTARTFPLPGLAPRLARIAESLEHGCGIATVRGIPSERFGEDDLRWLLWGIGAHIGTAVSQNTAGDLLAEVRDYGEPLGLPHSRGYRTNVGLRFHTDRCDVVALLCVRQCRAGGESRIVSTPALHNRMLALRPDLLEELFGSYFHSRQSEQTRGERRFYESPVFAIHAGRFTSQYSRAYVESAQRFPEVPRLRPAQDEALELLARLADELCFETRMQPGDLQLLNNHVTYHGRTDIVDFDDPARKRLLYRLWLSVPASRELPESFRELWRETAAGAVRGGVTPASGARDAATWRRRYRAADADP